MRIMALALARLLAAAAPAADGGTGGGFLTHTSPLAAPPYGDCPWCPDDGANAVTGSCSCPPGFGLIQPLATISDCAYRTQPPISNPPLRPASIGLCMPIGFELSRAAFGGAWQADGWPGVHDRCRSVNLITGACTCPEGYAPTNVTAAAPRTMPGDGTTPMGPTTIALCVPSAHRPGFGGAYQVLDAAPAVQPGHGCSTPNPLTGNCSCAAAAGKWTQAAQSFRVVTYVPGSPGAVVGSNIVVCTELLSTAAASGSSGIDTTPPNADAGVEICAGVKVDNTGKDDASLGVRKCIAATTHASSSRTLSLPAGTYLLHSRLDITEELTLRTVGVSAEEPGCGMPGSPRCAVFRAAPELTDAYGLLLANGVSRLTIDHIVLDGNRGQRLSTGPGLSCGGKWAGHEVEGRQPAYNSGIHSCSNCSFYGFASINAICGTGCEFSGPSATFKRCLFQNNGDHFGRQSGSEGHKWSDGLTMGSGPDAVVAECLFQDNSDINFIIADAHGALIESNLFRMVSNGAFGGIMMDNFNNPALSNHSGAVVRNNSIDGGDRMHYGIELGPRPWYTAGGNIRGPVTVTGNTIQGAGYFIDADGAGMPGAAFIVTSNAFLGDCVAAFACVDGEVRYNCSLLNISPNSTVDRKGESRPSATHLAITSCP